MTKNANFPVFTQLDTTQNQGVGGDEDQISQGGRTFTPGHNSTGTRTTLTTPSTGGKWYCEFYCGGTSIGNYAYVGYFPVAETGIMKKQWVPSGNTTWIDTGLVSFHSMGRYFYTENQYTDSGAVSFTVGDIIQIALDLDNGATYFGKNNTWNNSGDPTSGASKTGAAPVEGTYSTEYSFAAGTAGSTGVAWTINGGQDSTFCGLKSTGTANASDGNGYGDFYYAPPSGYLALFTANIAVGTSIDPATTDDNHPVKNFNALIYSGDGTSSNAITGLGFQPDLVWIKQRNNTNLYSHSMTDSLRGRDKVIFAEDTREEDVSTSTQDLTAFGTDGFTVGSNNETASNGSTDTMIAWCWRCNAGTNGTNTSGTITSTVQANQDLGFSIVSWTGTGTASTIGHGLSAAPDCIWIKNRTDNVGSDGDASGQNWAVYHSVLGNTKYLSLNTTSNASTSTNWWNNTSPTSSVFTVGTDNSVNESSHAMIAYCWHNIEGFQKFGSYTGNGNSNGPYVNCGFRPRLVIIKMTNGSYSEHWNMWDSADDGDRLSTTGRAHNQLDEFHRITEATEATSTSLDIDFLANGFKVRGSNTEMNENGKVLVYFAWADVPFKYSNAF